MDWQPDKQEHISAPHPVPCPWGQALHLTMLAGKSGCILEGKAYMKPLKDKHPEAIISRNTL